MSDNGGYNGNPHLPKSGSQYSYTKEQAKEIKKCMADPVYFAETYFKIISVDDGLVPFKLYDFQKEAASSYLDERKMILATSRQIGKTSIATVIVLHYALFNSYKKVFILANKADTALEILSRIQLAYEHLPNWLKAGVIEWNKGTVEFDNGTRIAARATSSDNIRGQSCVTDDTMVCVEVDGSKIETTIKDVLDNYSNANKILSQDGTFKEFDGFSLQGEEPVREFILSDGNSIKATKDHRFLLEGDMWVTAELMDKGDVFSTGLEVIDILESDECFPVYDAIEVKDTHSYWTNGVISHNCNLLYIDECAFVNGWTDFSASVLPTISSGKKTKLIFTSTPNGLNHFYDYYNGAKKGTNGFKLIEVKWYDVPGRDEAWRQETLATINHDEERFAQEYSVSFIGSSGTLISGAKLKELFTEVETPIHYNAGFGYKVYKEPKERRTYTIIVDVSRGKGQDYSAFQVLDTTEAPYEQVAIFRNNMITPTDYARFIFQTAKGYNDAYVLVELNDIGGQVADLLALDYEYENVIYTSGAGASGKRVTFGYGDSVDRGIRTTKTVKGLGCSMLKLLIEQDKIRLYDADTIQELAVFSQKGQSYEAEEGYHDDTVMCLVLFAWLTTDDFFKNMNDENVLHSLRELTDKQIEETLVPFGVVHSGVDETIVEEWGGERWELESGVFDSTDSFGGW